MQTKQVMTNNDLPNNISQLLQRILQGFNFCGVEDIVQTRLRDKVIITGILPSGKKPRCSIDFSPQGSPHIDCTHIFIHPF